MILCYNIALAPKKIVARKQRNDAGDDTAILKENLGRRRRNLATLREKSGEEI